MELMKADEAAVKSEKARVELLGPVSEHERQEIADRIEEAIMQGKTAIDVYDRSPALKQLLMDYGYSVRLSVGSQGPNLEIGWGKGNN